VISTPVSVVAALASASRAGVLVKGGALLEAPARLQAVALDKTGTLTHGRPELVELRVLADGLDRSRALALAAALERASSHPLAHAVLEAAEREEVEVPEGEGVEVLAGLGVRGRVQGASFGLGNRGLLEIEEVDADALFREVEQVQRAGATTTVLFDGDRRPLALFAFADRVREGSRQALDELRRVGIRHIALLTGDQVYPAGVAGREAGVDEVHARLLPLAKQEQVEALRDRYGSVAMVGDGINDAPAMAAASLSVSMGEVGTDVAIETSDVSLMSDDLGRLAWLIRHSRRMLATIRVNVAFALAAKAVFLGLAAVDLATLWMAIAADMGASLLVTVNSLRLLRARPEQK
jgi:Cd2+/Zn2+-exporting ATPase